MTKRMVEKSISDIIHESFIEYAKEVIEDRAIPDIKDGLKPVQRRILYTMLRSGFTEDKPYRKSAATVGETLKNLHPHGDSSIYNALVKLIQGFNKRYPLAQGHGNFGTTDDGPAAMRYTECRLSQVAMEMLKDIDKDTVSWRNNYDDTQKEPLALPSVIPNLLINGGTGIAVGLASNIPPHNLKEVVDGILAYIKNNDINTKDLLKHIKGPDFPTGAIVCPKDLLKCYEEGIGAVPIRAKAIIEELPDNKKQIIITDIPYQISKNTLLNRISKYIEDKWEDEVDEIRDETDKNGNRIIIEMDKGKNAEKLLKELYENTSLQSNFNYNMVALVDNKPLTLSLKSMICEYVKHRKNVVIKRTNFDLKRANNRIHIVEGLIRSSDLIDDIISIIRNSKTVKTAKEKLIKELEFTNLQAQSILELKLQRLTSLEINSLNKEYKALLKEVKGYEKILSSDKNVLEEIKKELIYIKEAYGDDRKTLIKEFDKIEVKVKKEEFTLQVNDNKTIKKLSKDYKGDKGILLKTDSTNNIYMFNEDGKVIKFTGTDYPNKLDKKVINLCNEDCLLTEQSLIFISSDGQVKKSFLKEYLGIKSESPGIRLNKGAKVVDLFIEDIKEDLVLLTKNGYVIRFSHKDINEVGKIALGVKGIGLEVDDTVIGAINIGNKDKGYIRIKTKEGDKKIEIDKIKNQKRAGKGNRFFNNIEKIIGTSLH